MPDSAFGISSGPSEHPEAVQPSARWPEVVPEQPVLFLVETHSRTERRLIDQWIKHNRPSDPAGSACETNIIRIVALPPARRQTGRLRLDPELANLLDDFAPSEMTSEALSDVTPREGVLPESRQDPILAPLRVIWRGVSRPDDRRPSLFELLTAGDPRDPGWLRQLWVSQRSPERCAVIAGEPAPLSDLRRRWLESSSSTGENEAPNGFARFVAQKATLSLERAERRIRGARYKVPRLIHDEILTRRDFRKALYRLKEKTKNDPSPDAEAPGIEGLTERAAKILREMAASHSPFVIDLFTLAIRKIYTRGYAEKLVYNETHMRGIAALQERHPVVFLPSHKSQLDHLVLQYALHEQGLPPNHTAGGKNMNFFPVGPFLRRSGVFFIRRSFKDDALYRQVLSSYIDYLIEKRFPLEWYIEGGRSRSGKLLPPQYGLLSRVLEAYRREMSEDVYFVPVSIAYDQIQDVRNYAAEQRGETKEKESFSWMLRALRQLKRRYGKIHIAFGEPLSLRDEIGTPAAMSDAQDERKFALQKLAFEICVRINRATPITPTSLVTLALLGATGQALTVPETRRSLANLLALVRHRDLPTTAEFNHLETDDGIEYTLEALVENDVVKRFDGGLETVYGIGKKQQLAAAYYRNTIVHFFVTAAISELALLHCLDHPRAEAIDRFWDEVMRLRDLLKFEFFFPRKRDFREEIRFELSLTTRDWEKRIEEFEINPDDLLRRTKPLCAHRILRPFLESYRVAADQLATMDPEEPFDEKRFYSSCLGLGQQYELQRRIHGADSVSKTLFATALQLAENRGLVSPVTEEEIATLAERRSAFAEEIRDAVRRVDIIVALAAGRRAGFQS